MATQERSGIRAVIPWVALSIVTIFAFSQLDQRNRALSRATKAEDNLDALEAHAGARTPAAVAAPVRAPAEAGGITEREKKLDAALQQALELHREDSKQLASLQDERDAERARAARLDAQRETEAARADSLARRLADIDEEAASRAERLAEQLGLERDAHAAERAGQAAALEAAAQREQELQAALAARDAQAGELRTAHEAQLAETLERGTALSQTLAEVVAVHKREVDERNAEIAALEAQLAETEQRVHAQLDAAAGAVDKAQDELNRMAAAQQAEALERARAETRSEAAEASLRTLRRRLREAAAAQLAAEDPETILSGARMVELLKLNGASTRLLALTDHEEGAVAAAAARALAAAPDLAAVVLPASDAAVAMMADDAIGVRMAGLALLQAASGRTIAFDPGAEPEARAAALAKLKKQLGS